MLLADLGCPLWVGGACRHPSPGLSGDASHATSRGLIWPKDGCASIDLPQRLPATFFPCETTPRDRSRGDPGSAHSSRGKKAASRRPTLRCGPRAGASSIASGL